MLEFANQVVISQVSPSASAGTSAVTTGVIDQTGFDAVCFIADVTPNVNSVLTLTANENSVNSTSGGTAVTNGATSPFTAIGSTQQYVVSDVIRPSQRYVYATLARTTQNVTVNGVMAIQYRARNIPTTQSAAVVAVNTSTPEK